ncbi:MAG TPA: hypothetical protein VFF27_14110 [Bacteroidia bacterium]|jgi:hypothetical protein|nr:hypothetical protein [Bacteroidia bacterium]
MKQLSIFLIIVLSACHAPTPTTTATASNTDEAGKPAKVNSDINKIEFRTGSRAYHKRILLTKDSVLLTVNSSLDDIQPNDSKTVLTAEEWNKVINSLQGVDVHQLEKLKSPTMKRAVDAADGSTITITTDKESSHSFDNLDPNAELKKLLDVLSEIEKSRNKK